MWVKGSMCSKLAHRKGRAAAVGVIAALAIGGVARADDAKTKAAGAGAACQLAGTTPVGKGTKLYRTAQSTDPIAVFTGASAPLLMQDIPPDAATGRARLSTTETGQTLRIDGFAVPAEIPMFTRRDIAVVGTQVWLAAGESVKLLQSQPDALTVVHDVAGTASQKVKATAPCDAFALEPGAAAAGEVDGHARGYMMKSSTIDLYDKPGGDVVFTLKMIEGAGQLFWSTRASAGFVEIKARGDLVIDAWARAKDLTPLPPGELRDRYIPPVKGPPAVKLKLQDAPRIVKATSDIPLRAKRETNAPAIGLIEVGAELYVLETVGEWTNVLPRGLYVTPPETGGFWIPAAEVPETPVDAAP
jgi:hypothetical protein